MARPHLALAAKPPDGVADLLTELPDSFLECRELGHAWRPLRALHSRRHRTFDVSRRCSRCGTERTVVMSERGEVYSSSYLYPKHYSLKGVAYTTEVRDLVRLQGVTRRGAEEVDD